MTEELTRYIARIEYKALNEIVKNVIVRKAISEKQAREIIEAEFNSDGKILIEIKSLRSLDEE